MEQISYKGNKVLIVDDIEEVIIATKNALEFDGIQVIGMDNGNEALEYLRKNKVDLILLDFFMPSQNGDEFLDRLREFDKTTIVILQTGYADKIPPLDMMDKMNIQGYIDKNRGAGDLILQVKSALKTSDLLKTIDKLTYQNDFIGKLSVSVTDEAKDQVMAIAGQREVIDDVAEALNNENLKEISEKIGIELAILAKTFQALDFASQNVKVSRLGNIFDTVEILTRAKSSAYFKYREQDDELATVNSNGKYLIYILSEIILYLYENNVGRTEIIGRRTLEGVSILINKPHNYSDKILAKINEIAEEDENIQINNNEILEIVVR